MSKGKIIAKKTIAMSLVGAVMGNMYMPIWGQSTEALTNRTQITSDYNTSIGTGSQYLFGGVGTPSKDEAEAWQAIAEDMGMKVAKVPIDLARLYPHDAENIDTDALEDYTHVAGSIFTSMRASGMEVMLQFYNIPTWLDTDSDYMYDSLETYGKIVAEFLEKIKEYNDIIKFAEITPYRGLTASDFSTYYYETAKIIREKNPQVVIGGPGDVLENKNDALNEKMRNVLKDSTSQGNEGLLQFVSVRGYGVNPIDGNGSTELFGEFKQGRKIIRELTKNADLPLFMTGWTSSPENGTADQTIFGVEGIKYHTSALFKSIRDGWDLVLFDSIVSEEANPSSYLYRYENSNPLFVNSPITTQGAIDYAMTTPPSIALELPNSMERSGEIVLNPFYKVYNLLGKQLGLNEGEFKVVSTNMGKNWAVQDSIAMVNSRNEAVMLFLNFEDAKTNVSIEMKNVPYEDGKVTLKAYVASETHNPTETYFSQEVEIQNGILTTSLPSIPLNSVMGIRLEGGVNKALPAQSLYEFESQDNHFGGNMEIVWSTNASFNRVVKGFGGENHFTTFKNVFADGSGTYRVQLYAENSNSSVRVSVNDAAPILVDASAASLTTPVEFDVTLEAGGNNTLKVYTESGELRPDKLVLIPQNVELGIGLQNLGQLATEGIGEDKVYILPLTKKDFKLDARIFPESAAQGKTLQFNSSDDAVVTVNSEGVLMPKTVGEAVITVSIEGFDAEQSFKVSVRNRRSEITIEPSRLTLRKGGSATLTATSKPSDAEDKELVWSSSNINIVTVMENANETAEIVSMGQVGTAIITAASLDGKIKGTCTVSVIEAVAGGNVMIDYDATIAQGSGQIFGITHYPSINDEDSDIGNHSEVWDLLRDQAGVTFMRADARQQEILPIWTKRPNTNWKAPVSGEYDPSLQPSYVQSDLYYVTGPDGKKRQFNVDDYKADMAYFKANGAYLNGLSNPANWNTGRMLSWVNEAKATGFDVMAMTFQIPEWLSAGEIGSGDPHTKKVCNGAPKDWDIYRDIVKKIYLMLRDKIDYYEFLNEPHWYVPTRGNQKDPSGKPYAGPNMENKIAADQFYQAIDAIYEAERELAGNPNARPPIKLGGGADDSWGGTYGVLGELFSARYADWMNRIDFVSIHKYGENPANQSNSNSGANTRNLKQWIRQSTGRDIPLYLNEYNISTGQPQDETYGYKSLGWHTKLLIDMMIDGYEGGGYYTAYPADVPMDDYEASSGWIERGKGMYTWNNGEPYLATFAKAWGLLSNDLGLGKGKFDVKSTVLADNKITQAIGAMNAEGNLVAVLNNYSSQEYGNTSVDLHNVPFKEGSQVDVSIYVKDQYSGYEMQPTKQVHTVDENGNIQVTVGTMGAYSVCGILVEGKERQVEDQTTYEFESHTNQLKGSAKIETEKSASNGRWVVNANGPENSVTTLLEQSNKGQANIKVYYSSTKDSVLYYQLNEEPVQEVVIPATQGINKVELKLELESGINRLMCYTEVNSTVKLDKIVKTVIDKKALQKLVERQLFESHYTKQSWENYQIAHEEAIQVLADAEATTEHILNAYDKLVGAIEGLELMVDLEDLINQAFDAEHYTTLSWYRYAEAREYAISVLEADEEEIIIRAYNMLQNAMNKLERIPEADTNLMNGLTPTTNVPTTLENPYAATDGKTNCSDANEMSFTGISVGEETGGADNGYSQWATGYLQYDLGKLVDVNKVDIYRPYYQGGGPINWKDTQIQLATDDSFSPTSIVYESEIKDLRLPSGEDRAESFGFQQPIRAQYIRVNGKGHQGSWGGYSNKLRVTEIILQGTLVENENVLAFIINEVKEQLEDESYYDPTSYADLRHALERVEELAGKEGVTQTEINTALSQLATAKASLKVKIDKSVLIQLIEEIKESGVLGNEHHYTPESFSRFKLTYEKGCEVVTNEEVSQAEVNESIKDLREAYAALELNNDDDGNIDDNNSSNNNGDNTGNNDTSKVEHNENSDNKVEALNVPVKQIEVFEDVSSHWAYDSIKFVLEKGLFAGTSDTTFQPNEAMTRGMFITVLGRLDQLFNSKSLVDTHNRSQMFNDVDQQAYYSGYVRWAKDLEIVDGISAYQFGPNVEITREQLAVMIDRYIKVVGLELEGTKEVTVFKDNEKVSGWARESVQNLQNLGVMVGINEEIFAPQDKVTRGQVARVMHRLTMLIEKE